MFEEKNNAMPALPMIPCITVQTKIVCRLHIYTRVPVTTRTCMAAIASHCCLRSILYLVELIIIYPDNSDNSISGDEAPSRNS